MAKQRGRYEFTVQVDGKTYNCVREVQGVRLLEQSISVIGIGSENDGVRYGPRQHPVISMEGIARQIAHGVIRKHIKK